MERRETKKAAFSGLILLRNEIQYGQQKYEAALILIKEVILLRI
jgi:hypothetical protein